MPRLYHRKSRNGCNRCKARKVKCDEARPTCRGCERHEVSCVYSSSETDSHSRTRRSASTPSTSHFTQHDHDLTKLHSPSNGHNSSHTNTPFEPIDEDGAYDLPESKSRRMMEHRLMHNYFENVSQPFAGSQSPEVAHLWSIDVPQISFEHENLFYSCLTNSTSHMLRSDPTNTELLSLRERYLGLTLREQRKAVANLGEDNVDAVAFTSLQILINTFAMLHERDLSPPYTPPVEWLQMGRGAMTVMHTALKIAAINGTAKILTLINAPPNMEDTSALFSEENRRPFVNILSPTLSPEEILDPETLGVYEQTLSYIGSIHHAIKSSNEQTPSLCRRLVLFALYIPEKFIEFVEEQRPRALVVLAHYFAVATQIECPWWMGETPGREIEAIRRVLGREWNEGLIWPLGMVGLARGKG